MKNIFKFFSVMLAASTMMVLASCRGEENNPDNPDNPQTYTVTANVNDATLGSVTISPLQATYEPGTQVTLTATPASNANFVNWSNGETNATITITVNENVTLTANFQAKPQPSYNATLDGATLQLGWHQAACADLTAQAGAWMWLFQAAQRAEGTSVYFPYVVNYLLGSTTNDVEIYSLELYESDFYTVGDQQYGDWQQYDEGSINCTAIDLTAHTMSATMSATMYFLTDVVDNGAATDGSDATHKTLALTFNNITFDLEAKGGMKKMNVRK